MPNRSPRASRPLGSGAYRRRNQGLPLVQAAAGEEACVRGVDAGPVPLAARGAQGKARSRGGGVGNVSSAPPSQRGLGGAAPNRYGGDSGRQNHDQ